MNEQIKQQKIHAALIDVWTRYYFKKILHLYTADLFPSYSFFLPWVFFFFSSLPLFLPFSPLSLSFFTFTKLHFTLLLGL